MSPKFLLSFNLLAVFCASQTLAQANAPKGSIFTIPITTIDGKKETLAKYQGKALLLVNTASECGYTPQYKGLEELYQKFQSKGLVVLAFPSNDFGGQEPGSEAEIKKFCEMKYKTTFPLFSKVKVKGEAHPLFAWLQKESKSEVQWNFGKFLVGKDGKVIRYFSSKVDPVSAELTDAVEAALK